MKKLLVVSHTAGFRHEEGIEAGEPVIRALGESSGQYKIDSCRNAEEVIQMLTPGYLADYDGVIFLNTTGDLGIPDLPAFLKWIEDGHTFIGIHAAADTYRDPDHQAYEDMLGGAFRTHHQQCEVEPIKDDPHHPAVTPIPDGWKIWDEIYLYERNDRSKLHALLSVPTHPNDGSEDAGKPGDYLLSWCKMYGKGRVFYTAFGHRKDVCENDVYKAHLLGGILWSLGLIEGGATLPG
jgi:type 1 glutamine amidotransferase